MPVYENNNIVLYLHACYRVGGLFSEEHYETLVLFVVYFVLKMFKNIDFYIKQDARKPYAYFFLQSKNVI